MNRKPILFACMVIVIVIIGLGVVHSPVANASPTIFASPVQAGCYLARLNQCKIHVDPFTINLATGKKLVFFSLYATRSGSAQALMYNWRPDQSNPAPAVGNTYTPSLVAKDFAATCGSSYTVSLQGQDTGDPTAFQLGISNSFTCPVGTYLDYMPEVRR
jgi:hypothetical protein